MIQITYERGMLKITGFESKEGAIEATAHIVYAAILTRAKAMNVSYDIAKLDLMSKLPAIEEEAARNNSLVDLSPKDLKGKAEFAEKQLKKILGEDAWKSMKEIIDKEISNVIDDGLKNKD